jgi:serine/threonine protein kinase
MSNESKLARHVTFCVGADYQTRGSGAELTTVQFLVEQLDPKTVGNYRILVNYNIPRQGADLREIDLLLINRFGVFLIEVKDWRGYIETYDDGWYLDGIHQGNVLDTLKRKVGILHSLFFNRGGKFGDLRQVSVTGVVVLARGLERFKNKSNSDSKAIFDLSTQRLITTLSSTSSLQFYGADSWLLSNQDISRVRNGIYTEHEPPETRVGKYRILKESYFGNPFIAYEAEDTVVGRRVRLKRYEMPTVLPERMKLLKNHFLRNAKAVSPLNAHAHILHSYDFFQTDTEGPHVFYEVTELVDGRRLDEIMEATRKPISLEEQLNYLEPLCDALYAAHSYQPSMGESSPIYHRNVCPEVVFVARDGTVKLGDFDFAKLPGQKTIFASGGAQPDVSVFTSPEMRRAPSGVKAPGDIYSLGVLWFCLASLPEQTSRFEREHPESAITSLNLPDSARMLMGQMMAYAPDNRPQTMGEVLNGLKRLRAYT